MTFLRSCQCNMSSLLLSDFKKKFERKFLSRLIFGKEGESVFFRCSWLKMNQIIFLPINQHITKHKRRIWNILGRGKVLLNLSEKKTLSIQLMVNISNQNRIKLLWHKENFSLRVSTFSFDFCFLKMRSISITDIFHLVQDECAKNVHAKNVAKCVRNVHRMCKGCKRYVIRMLWGCVRNVPEMCNECDKIVQGYAKNAQGFASVITCKVCAKKCAKIVQEM